MLQIAESGTLNITNYMGLEPGVLPDDEFSIFVLDELRDLGFEIGDLSIDPESGVVTAPIKKVGEPDPTKFS